MHKRISSSHPSTDRPGLQLELTHPFTFAFKATSFRPSSCLTDLSFLTVASNDFCDLLAFPGVSVCSRTFRSASFPLTSQITNFPIIASHSVRLVCSAPRRHSRSSTCLFLDNGFSWTTAEISKLLVNSLFYKTSFATSPLDHNRFSLNSTSRRTPHHSQYSQPHWCQYCESNTYHSLVGLTPVRQATNRHGRNLWQPAGWPS